VGLVLINNLSKTAGTNCRVESFREGFAGDIICCGYWLRFIVQDFDCCRLPKLLTALGLYFVAFNGILDNMGIS
jgi:hypothetical protein|tara:strand:- start:180 stop:401 length:222 start_codon:yes stop_codon:yes gene_type:complete